MPNKPLHIKVPGKLMIAGEFAVLEPYQKLVVMAVDRFVYTTIEKSDQNHVTLENLDLINVKWSYKNHQTRIDSADKRTIFVEDAMTVVLKYLEEVGIHPNNFTLSIRSELDDESGIKYGLGSSAAVVISVITAILKAYLPENPSKDLIFKLSSISHVKTQGNGSGADIAASTYGGMLQYSSFQADWLKKELSNAVTLSELIAKDWPYLMVSPIELPESIHMSIGWTGRPASTSKLVNNILKLKTTNKVQFDQFLNRSETAINLYLQGARQNNPQLLLEGITQNRIALAEVGKRANTDIETKTLRNLCDLAEQYNGAGKPSGAGGGDCGIAFINSEETAEELRIAWEKAGIKPLDIHMYPFGAKEVND